jgi:glucosyl-dolichyl phosphate glucuronosyltransferase
MQPEPFLSVIVCTHNRAADVLVCVSALLASQGADTISILVVDNASDEPNRALLQAQLPENVQLILESTPGLSVARNTGLRHSTTEWVAFLDDDAIPFPNWIARAAELTRSCDPRLAFVAGAAHPKWPDHIPNEGVAPHRLGRRWRDLLSLLEEERWTDVADLPMVVGCNMLIRRSALIEVGAFPTELGRTPDNLLGGEEIACARRLIGQRWQVIFDKRLEVFHCVHPERLTPAWVKKRALAEGVLLRKCTRKPAVAAKVALSLPYLACLTMYERLRGDGGHEAYIRLWHNLGFVRETLRAV